MSTNETSGSASPTLGEPDGLSPQPERACSASREHAHLAERAPTIPLRERTCCRGARWAEVSSPLGAGSAAIVRPARQFGPQLAVLVECSESWHAGTADVDILANDVSAAAPGS